MQHDVSERMVQAGRPERPKGPKPDPGLGQWNWTNNGVWTEKDGVQIMMEYGKLLSASTTSTLWNPRRKLLKAHDFKFRIEAQTRRTSQVPTDTCLVLVLENEWLRCIAISSYVCLDD